MVKDYKFNGNIDFPKYDLERKISEHLMEYTDQPRQSIQSILYDKEKNIIFRLFNNFMTFLIIDKERLEKARRNKSNSNEKKILEDLKWRMETAYYITTQLKKLIHIETDVWVTLKNKKSPKDKYRFNKFKKSIESMKRSIYSFVQRYNIMRIFLDLPKDSLYAEIDEALPIVLTYVSKKKRQEIAESQTKFKESPLVVSDLRSPMDLLQNRIVDHGITPVYRFVGKNTSGELCIYRYSCSLFGMYVEGSGNRKSEAKLNTATQMLHTIIKRQKHRTLSSHIREFNDNELASISPLIKLKTNYVEALNNECIKSMHKTPVYTLLSQTNDDDKLDNHFSIQCDAMDFVAIGHSNTESEAKQTAAQTILDLWKKFNATKSN